MTVDPVNSEPEPEQVVSEEDRAKEAAERLHEISKDFLQAFLYLEERMKEATQIFLSISDLLEEDEKSKIKQMTIFEGDNSAN